MARHDSLTHHVSDAAVAAAAAACCSPVRVLVDRHCTAHTHNAAFSSRARNGMPLERNEKKGGVGLAVATAQSAGGCRR